MKETNYFGRDQYGNTYWNLGAHPRKALSGRLSGAVSKMYRDVPGGDTVHVGYVIGPVWVTLYAYEPMEKPA